MQLLSVVYSSPSTFPRSFLSCLGIMNMFNIFCWPNTSRWSKASRCKKIIKRARCRLIQLKKRRQVIAMQLRKDLNELIQNGHKEIAIKRVERLIEDQRLVDTYELLDHFSVFILDKLRYIERNKDCPPDINEAVSSLIFASARCGNFPELYTIRKLFGQYYGQDFATAAVELFPGNLVNQKLIENLSAMTMSDDENYMMLDEISMDNCKDNLLGTHSCTPQRPKHVHPSLPEFEDIVTVFMALKRKTAS